jgi:hypothetical protein
MEIIYELLYGVHIKFYMAKARIVHSEKLKILRIIFAQI